MKSMIIVPTYNESENLERLIAAIRALPVPFEITIVDDGSPDGTGQLAESIAARDKGVHVIHRSGKQGLGTAYVAGFKYALQNGVEAVFEMDADFSHDPAALPLFLDKLRDGADVVIGSRYVNGVRVLNWSFKRLLLSKMATLYVDLIYGMCRVVLSFDIAVFIL
jgi:dolichol-phosphate mannosyltransferase